MSKKFGITLIELIIALALLGILFSLVFLVYNVGVKIFLVGEERSELRIDMGRAVAIMVKELRRASGVTSASNRTVTFWIDQDLDGERDSNEEITYSFSGVTGEALVRMDQEGSRNLLRSVSSFSLAYDSDLVDRIHLINLSLSAKRNHESLTISTSVKGRNMP